MSPTEQLLTSLKREGVSRKRAAADIALKRVGVSRNKSRWKMVPYKTKEKKVVKALKTR
ncbi:hypothetical protein U1Q18_013218, partial [Sarracenia purpurea var. burkii]